MQRAFCMQKPWMKVGAPHSFKIISCFLPPTLCPSSTIIRAMWQRVIQRMAPIVLFSSGRTNTLHWEQSTH